MSAVRARLVDKLNVVRAQLVERRTRLEARKQARIERVFDVTRARLLREQSAQHAVKPWGMADGGAGYESDSPHDDDAKAHDVPVKSFADDIRRKSRLASVMPEGRKADMMDQPAGQKEALKKLLRRVETEIGRSKNPKMIKVLKGVRSAATLLQQEAMSAGSIS